MPVVATATGAAGVLAAWEVACETGAAVDETGVATALATGVTVSAGAEEVHPAMNAVSNKSPQTMLVIMTLLTGKDFFMMDRSIAL